MFFQCVVVGLQFHRGASRTNGILSIERVPTGCLLVHFDIPLPHIAGRPLEPHGFLQLRSDLPGHHRSATALSGV